MSPVDLLRGRTDFASILFFDIRGFSSAAENMQPQELLQALNDHLQLITQVGHMALTPSLSSKNMILNIL